MRFNKNSDIKYYINLIGKKQFIFIIFLTFMAGLFEIANEFGIGKGIYQPHVETDIEVVARDHGHQLRAVVVHRTVGHALVRSEGHTLCQFVTIHRFRF